MRSFMPRVSPAPLYPGALFMELKQREMYLSFSPGRFLHFNGALYADARTSGDGEKARRDRVAFAS